MWGGGEINHKAPSPQPPPPSSAPRALSERPASELRCVARKRTAVRRRGRQEGRRSRSQGRTDVTWLRDLGHGNLLSGLQFSPLYWGFSLGSPRLCSSESSGRVFLRKFSLPLRLQTWRGSMVAPGMLWETDNLRLRSHSGASRLS